MKLLIIANWKCNPTTLTKAKQLFNNTKKRLGGLKNMEVVICPPFVYLDRLGASAFAKGFGGLALGSQDCFWEEKGAFTGEISTPMLKNLGVEYVITGHSERRKYFGETDEMINQKLKTVLKIGLKSILCIGETKMERKQGKTNHILRKQLIKCFKNIRYPRPTSPASELAGGRAISNIQYPIAIAYEPVWAIGTGNPCRVEDASGAFVFIRNVLAKIYNRKIANNIRIIYGGSVNSQNASTYIKESKMNGLLVGGASLDPKEFTKIIKSCKL